MNDRKVLAEYKKDRLTPHVHRNQGWRPATYMGADKKYCLIKYEMPNGAIYYNLLERGENMVKAVEGHVAYYKSISLNKIKQSKKWSKFL
ncbi:MAG: hypothetical protein ACXAC2_00315 [Candidatus Kariarchaeaceae archaeon]|jgi:hypothetical protein